MKLAEIEKQWREEVYDQAKTIDPENEELWGSLALGWCLGKGYTLGQAKYIIRHLDKSMLI